MKTWSIPDRHPTRPGPWADEPDKAHWIDPATGLDCLVVRNMLGALCGYVGVPPGHPWHGVDYDDVTPHPDVHGGLTFGRSCDGDEETGVCHVPEAGRPDDVWWLGFDCAHLGDLEPTIDEALGYRPSRSDVYRTFDYVRAEVTGLAEQAGRMSGGSGP